MNMQRKYKYQLTVAIFLFFISLVTLPGLTQEERRINLNLTNVPIDTVLMSLSRFFGLNVVASRDARGNVSVSLTNATLEEALDAVTKPNNWVWVREGNTITIMTRPEFTELLKAKMVTKVFQIRYTSARDIQGIIQPMLISGEKMVVDERTNQIIITATPETLASIESMIANVDIPVVTEVFQIKYAVASDIRGQLETLKTPRGKIDVNERLNTLIITDVESAVEKMRELIAALDVETVTEVFKINYAKPEDIEKAIKPLLTKVGYTAVDKRNSLVIVDDIPPKIEKARKVVEAMDAPDKLVFIEAEIVDIGLNTSLDLGIDWSYVVNFGLTQQTATWIGSGRGLTIPLAGSWKDAIRNAFSANTSTLFVGLTGTGKALSKLDSDVEILATPRLFLKNDEEGTIHVGGTQPYTVLYTQPVTGTAGTYYQQYYSQVSQEYGIKLKVKPHINEDGTIEMKLSIEDTSAEPVTLGAGGATFTGVKTTTSKAETTVIARNNQTVVIGGLVSRRRSKSGSGIPVLSNLPVLGYFFGARSSSDQKRNLLLFITPHVIPAKITQEELAQLHPELYKTLEQTKSEDTVRSSQVSKEVIKKKKGGFVLFRRKTKEIAPEERMQIELPSSQLQTESENKSEQEQAE